MKPARNELIIITMFVRDLFVLTVTIEFLFVDKWLIFKNIVGNLNLLCHTPYSKMVANKLFFCLHVN